VESFEKVWIARRSRGRSLLGRGAPNDRMGTPTYLCCCKLIKALGKKEESRAPWAEIIAEILAVSNLLPDYRLPHVGCESNQVAHMLAQRAIKRKECKGLRFDMPEECRLLVQADAARINLSRRVCNNAIT
jgi:hypothetical protein